MRNKSEVVKTIRGKTVEISYDDIVNASREQYTSYRGTDYYAVVEGRVLPAKRLLEEVLRAKGTGLTLQDITTKHAVDIFRDFDIPVFRKMDLLKFLAGAISIGGDAVEEEKRLYSS